MSQQNEGQSFSKEDRKKYREDKLKAKLKKAEDPFSAVIMARSPEVVILAELLDKLDNSLTELRSMSLGRSSRIPMDKTLSILSATEQVQDTLHQVNKKIASVTGRTYIPPYNYKRAVKQAKGAGAPGSTAAAPAAAH